MVDGAAKVTFSSVYAISGFWSYHWLTKPQILQLTLLGQNAPLLGRQGLGIGCRAAT